MDITTECTSPLIKKVPFTQAEKNYLQQLVKSMPIIELKTSKSANIEKKKIAWISLTEKYNAQAFTTNRTMLQLKRCWENMKSMRKKELAEERSNLMRTGGGPPGPSVKPNPIDSACPHIDLVVPGVIDSNTIELNDNESEENPILDIGLADKNIEVDSNVEIQQKPKSIRKKQNIYIKTESEGRLLRLTKLIEFEEELHVIRMKREQVMLKREEIMLKKEEEELEFQRAKRQTLLLWSYKIMVI